jgi:integrase
MPRPRKDGTSTRSKTKDQLTELYVQKLKPESRRYLVWDTKQGGLALQVRPNGHRSWKCIYSLHGRVRWYDIGAANKIGLAKARKLAADVMYEVAKGKDPQAEKRATRSAGTFEELAARYRDEYAKKENSKSWQQADYLVRKHLLPRWGSKLPANITRSEVKAVMREIGAPVVANQTLAAASAIFTWAIKEEFGGVVVHPCKGVERNDTKSRERVLSDTELPRFWDAFDKAGLAGTALKLILLTGQRPGEVTHMRSEHIDSGWWTMPGAPVAALGWPGTKNAQTHRVWLPREAQELLARLEQNEEFLLADRRGRPVNHLDAVMRAICTELDIADKVTPHDLRRTHGTKVTGLGFGREAMNRIQNHREGGIADVYDRHEYAEENKRVMEAVATELVRLAQGGNVVPLRPAVS